MRNQINEWRRDFPFFKKNPEIIYFDNAATTQKPQVVIDTLCDFYGEENAVLGRSLHKFASRAERRCDEARTVTASFIGADKDEIVFTKSATESANMIACAYAFARVGRQSNIVVTALEHNSNFLPWYEVCRKKHAELRIAALDMDGYPDLESLEQQIDEKTVLVAATCASNFLHGRIPYEEIAEICRRKRVPLVLDAAQLVAHERIDVRKTDCDFLFFSGHKMFAPAGIGVLYAKRERIEEMSPFLVGGGIAMGDNPTHYIKGVGKLEAGTQDAAARLALASAIDYIMGIEEKKLAAYEMELSRHMIQRFEEYEKLGVRILGNHSAAMPVFSFICEDAHCFDIAAMLNRYHIAVRSGKVCAQNAFSSLGVDGCVRLSLCFYNTFDEVELFFEALNWILKKIRRC